MIFWHLFVDDQNNKRVTYQDANIIKSELFSARNITFAARVRRGNNSRTKYYGNRLNQSAKSKCIVI